MVLNSCVVTLMVMNILAFPEAVLNLSPLVSGYARHKVRVSGRPKSSSRPLLSPIPMTISSGIIFSPPASFGHSLLMIRNEYSGGAESAYIAVLFGGAQYFDVPSAGEKILF